MMAHRQTDFWELDVVCTVKANTVRNERYLFHYKNEKNEKVKREKAHRDSVKKMKASVTAALIEAKAKHATLLVKASFMEKKYELEAKQRALQRKLELLELESKMAAVDAKLAFLKASKKVKDATSRSAPYESKDCTLKPQNDSQVSLLKKSVPFANNDTGADAELDDVDWEGPDIDVPPDVCEDSQTSVELNELDWEGPEIYVQMVVCQDTGAGYTTEMPSSVNESPDVPHPEALRSQQGVLNSDINTTMTKLDPESCLDVDQPPSEGVVAGSMDEEPGENTAVPILEEGSNGLVIKRPSELVTVSSKDGSNAEIKIGAVVLSLQTLREITFEHNDSVNPQNCTVATVLCILFLLVGQAHKLFQLQRYKAFKRKRWKFIL